MTEKLVGTLSDATKVLSAGQPLLTGVVQVAEQVWELQEKALEDYDKLCEKNTEVARAVDTTLVKVNSVVSSGRVFITALAYFVATGANKAVINNIKQQVLRGDFSLLRKYLEQMAMHIDTAERRYQDFAEECEGAEKACWEGEAVCGQGERSAKTKKRKTQAVGGAASATLLAGGVASSAAVGFLSLGLGTIVGLSITAASAFTIGSGVGVGTACVAHDFSVLIREFRNKATVFKELGRLSFAMKQQVNDLHSYLSSAADQVDHVECAERKALNGHQILKELELLWAQLNEFYPGVDRALNRVEEAKTVLDGKVNPSTS